MAIENLGSKLYSGTKADRVSDSLGTTADGTNSGITLTPIKTNSSTNKIDFKALRDGVNHALSYDLGATLSDTLWTCRFVINFSKLGSSGNGNYLYVGLSDKDSSTAQNGNQDFIGIQIQADGTSNYFSNDSDGASISGTGSGDNSQSWSPSASTNYYVEIIRSSATAYSITVRTGSHSGTSLGTVSGTCANTTVGLRYFKVLNVINSSGGRDLEGTIDTITIDNGASTYSSADYTVNPNSTTGWSGNYKLGTGAYSFDGSNDYVQLSTKFNYLHDGTGGSIAFWVKPRNLASVHTNGDIIFDSMATSGANGTGIQIRFKTDKGMRFNFTNSSNGWFTNVNSTTTFADDTWYHVAMTFGSSTVKVYVNGVLEDTETYSNPNTNASGGNFTIGRHATDPSSYGYFDGVLDDIGIYKRVLTATEIGKLANNNSSPIVEFGTADDSSMAIYDARRAGERVTDTSLRNISITSVTARLFRYNTTNGSATLVCRIRKLSDDSVVATSSTVAMSNLSGTGGSTSSATDQTFTFSGVTTPNEDYQILIEGSTTSNITGSNPCYVVEQSSVTSNKGYKSFYNSSYSYDTGKEATFDVTYPSTGGDAQLVSTLSNKAGLKAHYTMDSTSMSLPTATVNEQFDDNTGWTLNNASISNNSITVTGSSESYKSITGLGKPNKLTWDFTFTRNSGDAGDSPSVLLSSQNSGYGDPSSGHTNVQFYLANGNTTWLSVRKNSGSGNVQTQCNFGTGSSSVNIQPTGTTRYYRITKNGSVWTMKKFTSASDRTNDTNAEASATATQTSTADSTWDSGSGNLIYLVLDGHASGTKNYTVSDVKVYEGVTEGCKNDFSSTSDLEALTGVRTNSIFQQTDDTPTYWWYNGTSWVLDGTTNTELDSSTYYPEFTVNSSANIASPVYDLGSVNDEKWILRFKVNYRQNHNNTYYFIGIGSNESGYNSSQDFLGVLWRKTTTEDKYGLRVCNDDQPQNADAVDKQQFTQSDNTDYFFEIVRESATSAKVNYYGTDSTYTTTVNVSDSTSVPSGLSGLKYLKVFANNASNATTYVTPSAFKFQNGTSEWIE